MEFFRCDKDGNEDTSGSFAIVGEMYYLCIKPSSDQFSIEPFTVKKLRIYHSSTGTEASEEIDPSLETCFSNGARAEGCGIITDYGQSNEGYTTEQYSVGNTRIVSFILVEEVFEKALGDAVKLSGTVAYTAVPTGGRVLQQAENELDFNFVIPLSTYYFDCLYV